MQASMHQRKGIGLVVVIGLVFLGLRSMRSTNGASLSGWSIDVAQEPAQMGNFVSRRATASGTVTNDGDLSATYSVRLRFNISGIGFLETNLGTFTLAPGQSASKTISLSRGMESGETATITVFLDRISPSASNGVDSFSRSYTESHPHAVGGALSGWSVTVAQRHGLRARRR